MWIENNCQQHVAFKYSGLMLFIALYYYWCFNSLKQVNVNEYVAQVESSGLMENIECARAITWMWIRIGCTMWLVCDALKQLKTEQETLRNVCILFVNLNRDATLMTNWAVVSSLLLTIFCILQVSIWFKQ